MAAVPSIGPHGGIPQRHVGLRTGENHQRRGLVRHTDVLSGAFGGARRPPPVRSPIVQGAYRGGRQRRIRASPAISIGPAPYGTKTVSPRRASIGSTPEARRRALPARHISTENSASNETVAVRASHVMTSARKYSNAASGRTLVTELVVGATHRLRSFCNAAGLRPV